MFYFLILLFDLVVYIERKCINIIDSWFVTRYYEMRIIGVYGGLGPFV